jgi:hypothetical protein
MLQERISSIIKLSLRSIGALLLIAADYREIRIVGLLHPDRSEAVPA